MIKLNDAKLIFHSINIELTRTNRLNMSSSEIVFSNAVKPFCVYLSNTKFYVKSLLVKLFIHRDKNSLLSHQKEKEIRKTVTNFFDHVWTYLTILSRELCVIESLTFIIKNNVRNINHNFNFYINFKLASFYWQRQSLTRYWLLW